MFVVLKNSIPWGYYDTKAEAIAAIEEERGKEDGVELVMIHEEETVTRQGYVEVTGEMKRRIRDQGIGSRE